MVGGIAIRGSRALHCTPAASAAINFANVASKVSNEADKARLLNLQKVHDTAKAGLMGVQDTTAEIDWAEWSSKISDAGLVDEIKAAYGALTLPDSADTAMVDHPAWDAAEFAKLSASLGLQNESLTADLQKLESYAAYLKQMKPVSDMTVDDVLGKNATLDYQVQRQMDEMELFNVDTDLRSPTHTAELDPRKKADPLFPDSNVVEEINAPARALAADILASEGMSAAVGTVFTGESADAFGQAVEGLLCQAPLVDPTAPEPVLDFSECPAVLEKVFDLKFPDVSEEARAPIVAAFTAEIEEYTLGAAKAAAAAKEAAVASAASVCDGMKGTTAVFAGDDAPKWAADAHALLCVQSGLDELTAAAGDSSSAIASSFAVFAKKPTAAGARKLATEYSNACDDVEAVSAMVELLEATVIQSELYTNKALKKQLANVFPSKAAQSKAYATWWPASGDATKDAVAVVAPFDNVAPGAESDAAFVLTKTIVTKHMTAIK